MVKTLVCYRLNKVSTFGSSEHNYFVKNGLWRWLFHFLFLLINETYHSFTSIIYHYCSLSFTLVIQNRSFDNGMHVIFTFFLVVLLLTHHINWSHWLSIVYLFLSGISYDLTNCKPVVLWTTFLCQPNGKPEVGHHVISILNLYSPAIHNISEVSSEKQFQEINISKFH